MTYDLETLAEDAALSRAERAVDAKQQERIDDLDRLTIVLLGLPYRGKINQCRVMLDNHREQRRLRTPAQVAWIYLDGRVAWLQGYSWAFDVESKQQTAGTLTDDEIRKIEELARAELDRIMPQIQAINEGRTSAGDNTSRTQETTSGTQANCGTGD